MAIVRRNDPFRDLFALQDQLFQRDLPLVRDSLRLPVTVALLKGRANYVCHHHLRQASADGTFASRADVRYLKRIEAFARRSTTRNFSKRSAARAAFAS